MWWRNDLNSMQKRMEAVLNNHIPDISHDVTFIVGDENLRMSCHKLFLSILSPVFEAMFSQRHDNNHNNPSKVEISVPDVAPAALRSIIKYAYTGILNINMKEAMVTMYAADKYDIPELTDHCSQILQTGLTIHNVMTVYQVSVALNDDKLKEKAWEFIQRNCGALMESKQFFEFSEDSLWDFLNLDYMPTVKSELDVFHAVLKWGNNQCDKKQLDRTIENVRAMLMNVIDLIRFPVMESDEFSDSVVPSRILSSEECVHLLKYFALSHEGRTALSETMKIKYSCIKRAGLFVASFQSGVVTGKMLPLHRSKGYDRFSVTGSVEKVKLKAVGVVIPRNIPLVENKTITIGLKDISIGTWTHTTKTVSKFLEICYIEFDTAVSIKPNVEYQAYLNHTTDAPVSVVQHPNPNQSLKVTNTSWINADNQNVIITFAPCNYVIWALLFES